ncbi:MAG: hypothetical protein R3B60_00290 [Candidatus Paceibacterota bacterium]
MKKVFFIFSICTLLLFVQPVLAQNTQNNVCFEKIFIVETGLGRGDFLAKFANYINDNKFSPRILGVFARQEAEKNDCLKFVPEEYRTIDGYTDAFLGYNAGLHEELARIDRNGNLVGIVELISIDQFLKIGRSEVGFRLPAKQM